ncbi:hypothetical protein Z517_09798 [Fonsecaea pedrosoi CBS 271.37]|uniref:Uncharacterized protein n=1 Tax=Fonsecaea pedrosoi CBS 271.37 TaxID=1442368 RepID=A0A0D2ESY5_9EURO|nr:uncharacterized protein Z517_09798 [Fonsecaea pedrosoi CBS 271.37]KIW77352.1 hypothetical protein Z517_09798 [Fonsecaea pedrosoi CBS 271.37]
MALTIDVIGEVMLGKEFRLSAPTERVDNALQKSGLLGRTERARHFLESKQALQMVALRATGPNH